MDIGQQDNCSNSFLYFFIRLHGQAVKTPPFHGGIRGSNPLGVLEQNIKGNSNCRLGSMAEQLICNQQVVGSTPTVGFLDLQLSWLEQPAHNRSVLGSSPRRSIFIILAQWLSWLERRPVTAKVESSSLFWVVSKLLATVSCFTIMESQLSWESICLTSRGSQVRALQVPYAAVAELADAQDLKSCGTYTPVPVRFRSAA